MTRRRDFLAQLSVAAAAMTFDADELRAAAISSASTAEWDTSWLDRLATAQYRVAFNASDISDGAALNYASTFLDHFHDVHDTADKQTRPVIVFRRLGTPVAFNDAMWERYPLGEDTKVTDSGTRVPAKLDVFLKQIETLNRRGLISLVCNVSVGSWGYSMAEKAKRDVEEVRRDLKANLIPGAILVPSGIYALIRAQNGGCAYMPGT